MHFSSHSTARLPRQVHCRRPVQGRRLREAAVEVRWILGLFARYIYINKVCCSAISVLQCNFAKKKALAAFPPTHKCVAVCCRAPMCCVGRGQEQCRCDACYRLLRGIFIHTNTHRCVLCTDTHRHIVHDVTCLYT